MDFPLKLEFKILALAPQISVYDTIHYGAGFGG